MKIQVTTTKETEAVVTVAATPEELAKIKQKVIKTLAPRVKLAGFREGKAPMELIEKNIDEATLQTEFINEAINSMYVQILKEEKLRPVDQPTVDVTKFVPFTTLEVTMKIPVIGSITIPDYKKYSAKRAEIQVDASQITEVLENLQTRAAEKKEVKRAAKAGDEAWIDFEGTDAIGEKIKGADGTDYPLVLGSGTFIPGFEEAVEGMKLDEVKSFELTFPKDYGAKELQNKKVTFKTTLKKVNEIVKPKLDDDFAGKVGPFTTLKQLKDDIKKQMEIEAKNKVERDFEAAIIDELVAKMKVALPQNIIDEQVEMVLQDVCQNAMSRGMTFEQFLETNGVDEATYREKEVLPEANRRIKASLLLTEIADLEGIVVEPEELEARMIQLKAQYSDAKMQEELDKPENRREINARIRSEKVINFLKK